MWSTGNTAPQTNSFYPSSPQKGFVKAPNNGIKQPNVHEYPQKSLKFDTADHDQGFFNTPKKSENGSDNLCDGIILGVGNKKNQRSKHRNNQKRESGANFSNSGSSSDQNTFQMASESTPFYPNSSPSAPDQFYSP